MSDDSMIELFRQEAQTQVAILTQGLLILESNSQSEEILQALMRVAHSIKGAARIISLDGVINLAHCMEDCFVAAQNKIIILGPEQIDVLLQGVDLFQAVSQVPETDMLSWLTENIGEFEACCAAIRALLPPDFNARSSLVSVEQSSEITPTPRQENGALEAITIPNDRVVRVSAENLNRIMGLAGESLVEANWLQPFADSFTVLRYRQLELSRLLETLHTALANTAISPESQQVVDTARQKAQECREILTDRLGELELYARRTTNLSDRLYREVIASHMRPFVDGVQGLPRMVRDLSRRLEKQVKFQIVGQSTLVDRDILKKLEAPLTHMIRNAVDHGIEPPEAREASGKPVEGTIRLEAFHRGGMLAISVSDDGKGIDPNFIRQHIVDRNLASSETAAQLTEAEIIEFLFLSGFSTTDQVTEISGRGVGLDIAKSMVQEVGGTIRAVSQLGNGTSFHFQLPLTLSVVRTLIVTISDEPYAFPLARVDRIVKLDKSEIYVVEGRQYFTKDGQNIGLIAAHDILDLPETLPDSDALCVVVISDQSNAYGLFVDEFLGERDLVVRPLDPRLGKVRDISASALMDDGSPVLILDVSDLVRSIDNMLNSGQLRPVDVNKVKAKAKKGDDHKRILVVDDSITVREMTRKLLQNQGYDVDVAVNGMDAWTAIRSNSYDLIVSDIDMPRMNGIELVKQIKQHPKFHVIPVIIVSYRDREDDRIQGMEAGANYYLTKSSFHDDTLINAIIDLIGR
ncbi:CheA signal transduction histidine kinase [Planktothrix sp. PCC 11201]|uniref:hybrid sensor histidine kinase/response regulator n=1 Tax=Planktothrix sp. PCC 11201 TaxID=1729650 RepID=UPI00091A2A05|nr:hybrid sensor histidine kinase/response regulator [Planktothrix sp. PCC 11201]SKB15438.1 CheA signal transduction histidine kinase [Planktothrix sp. PCC 11201]